MASCASPSTCWGRRPGGGRCRPSSLGALTAVLGLLYAVLDRDLKRVLAYSTIENVGVIFVALGLALAFRANGQHDAAARRA